MKAAIDINCDMGEGFGRWTFDRDVDARIMPLVSSINVAAGFHAGDPSTIRRTLLRAKELGVRVGVHPGFRDLAGFGRRYIDVPATELVEDVVYQLGAVRELARLCGVPLHHLKLHGALYMHAAGDEEFAVALIEAMQIVGPELPVLVMAGTVIEQAARDRGQPVIREFYADRHYSEDGQIVFTRDVGVLTPADVAAKVVRACRQGTVETVQGNEIRIDFESVCIHSDTLGADELVTATRAALNAANIEVRAET